MVLFNATNTGYAKNLVMPPRNTLTLQQTIKWQNRIISHDRWVIATKSKHTLERVNFSRRQLVWTKSALSDSLRLLQLRQYSLVHGSSQGICWDCWDRVANCESHGHWDTNTGNRFYGGLQFTVTTWNNSGGNQYASRADFATREEQIRVASKLSLSNWPVCGAQYYA